MIITRFAPSPTGDLHLGHAFAAIVAHSIAQKNDGKFLLRFEDLDHTRVRENYYQSIENDLRWLALNWDQTPTKQSERTTYYQNALERLIEIDVVYKCFCTRKEIANEINNISNAPHETITSLYPNTCRSLSPVKKEQLINEGKSFSWRLNMKKASALYNDLYFTDLKYGLIKVNPELLGDVIIARKDIGFAYHLTVVIDDHFQKITHVTRGDDLLSSTHIHRILQKILDYDEPKYFHHSLITDENRKRLAKRDSPKSLQKMRADGSSIQQIYDFLAVNLNELEKITGGN
jgi:glutamyl-Q tRNA(Asp) synthetase